MIQQVQANHTKLQIQIMSFNIVIYCLAASQYDMSSCVMYYYTLLHLVLQSCHKMLVWTIDIPIFHVVMFNWCVIKIEINNHVADYKKNIKPLFIILRGFYFFTKIYYPLIWFSSKSIHTSMWFQEAQYGRL